MAQVPLFDRGNLQEGSAFELRELLKVEDRLREISDIGSESL
jgi:hypothetical protein